MSIRAYRIITLKRAKNSTFNMWGSEDIIDFLGELEEGYHDYRNDDGAGNFEVSVEGLKELLKTDKVELTVFEKKAIKADIKFAEKKGDEWVSYDCF